VLFILDDDDEDEPEEGAVVDADEHVDALDGTSKSKLSSFRFKSNNWLLFWCSVELLL
jgi:hypothetical protein